MKPVLITVWLLMPCESPVVIDPAARTTTVIACPNTFREAAGPFLAEGWTPPKAEQVAAAPKKKKKRKKKRRARN
jgi:hypothetical protein